MSEKCRSEYGGVYSVGSLIHQLIFNDIGLYNNFSAGQDTDVIEDDSRLQSVLRKKANMYCNLKLTEGFRQQLG